MKAYVFAAGVICGGVLAAVIYFYPSFASGPPHTLKQADYQDCISNKGQPGWRGSLGISLAEYCERQSEARQQARLLNPGPTLAEKYDPKRAEFCRKQPEQC